MTTAANVNSPPSHSPSSPTRDGDAGGDEGDEAQVDAPKSGACARAVPLPAACLSQSLTCRRRCWTFPGSSHEAQSHSAMGTALATRTHSFHPKRHFAITRGLADLRLDGCNGMGCAHATRSVSPDLRQGVCVHAKPNRDCDCPPSTQQVVRLPDSPAQPGLSC